jgi:hypothetical protein
MDEPIATLATETIGTEYRSPQPPGSLPPMTDSGDSTHPSQSI